MVPPATTPSFVIPRTLVAILVAGVFLPHFPIPLQAQGAGFPGQASSSRDGPLLSPWEQDGSTISSGWREMTGLEPGAEPVGFRVVELADSARPGLNGGATRTVRAWLWYPAEGGTGETLLLERYVEEAARDLTVAGSSARPEVRAHLQQVMVQHGLREADLSVRLGTAMLARAHATPGQGTFPLLILGQGLFYESPLAQVTLCEYLASHGFVVATAPLTGASHLEVELSVEDFSAQVLDLALVKAGALTLLPVDPTRVAAGGFDLGGMAAFLLAKNDPSVRALVSLDSGIIFPHNMTLLEATPGFRGPGLDLPTLQVTRDREGNSAIGVREDFRYFENATTEDLYLVRIPGMRHPDFTSFLDFGTAPADLPFWGPEVGDPRVGHAQVAVLARDFLEAFTQGNEKARDALDRRLDPTGEGPSGTQAGMGAILTVTRGRQAGMVPSLPPSGRIPAWPSDVRGPYLGQSPPGDRPEIFAEGLVALGNHEHHLTLSPNGREMLWVIADKYRARHTLIRAVERDGVWLEPEVASFSGRYNDFAPSFHPDGSALLFCSNRPLPGSDEPTPDANIWVVGRTADGWGQPYPLPAPVNDGTAEYNPSITSDGLLVFQDHDEEGADIYSTRFTDGAWDPPRKIQGGVNSPAAEITPFVSADGSLLLFASDRPGGLGALDLYASRRLPDGGWADPTNLGEKLNSQASDAVPTLSPDGRFLFLTNFEGYGSSDFRNRSYEELARMLRSARNGDGTLYWVSTSFVEEMR